MHYQKRKELRATKVVLTVLKVIGGAGLIAMALCAPNAVQALGMCDRRYRRPSYINGVVERLARRGLVRFAGNKGRRSVKLTEKGERELAKYEEGKVTLPKPRRWDGKYRILIFDIWERRRYIRDALREFLRRLGFIRLQDSVWVYPYDCEEVAALLKTRFRVGNGLLYIVAETIENDRWLREAFGLSSNR
ncbi:MAG: phenylacetic acid degradation operon negative regulatory protein [Parcubacteria group bacterium Greene0416_79]|nr:MAG: phenylacetic acid degradation operon negative regulatory protein [Parcubacteria group bacterium Greene0416_79]